MKFSKVPLFFWLIAISISLCFFYALSFQPIGIINQGDQGTYLKMANDFHLGKGVSSNLTHRSPLYPLLISIFYLLFEPNYLLSYLISFQFALVFLTSIIIYYIFKGVMKHERGVLTICLLYLVSFSTISYAYTVLSETLTTFLLMLSILLILKYTVKDNLIYLIMSGVFLGLVILTRFNLLILPLTFLLFISIHHVIVIHKIDWGKTILHCVIFIFSVLLVLNVWCMYNLKQHNSYFLFPKSQMGQRYTTMALAKADQNIPSKFQNIHKIILRSKFEYLNEKSKLPLSRSSFLNFFGTPFRNHLTEITSGYGVFMRVSDTLYKYYGIDSHQPDAQDQLAIKMRDYNNILKKQNHTMLKELRLFSLLNSFKYSTSGDSQYHNNNLAKLPKLILITYKVIFLLISIFFLINSLVFVINILVRRAFKRELNILFLLLIISYFPAINFLAITYSDANRFKFPVEPLIFGLFIYFLYPMLSKVSSPNQNK